MRALCLQLAGGCAPSCCPPNPRAFLSRASLLQSSLVETHHASIVFANGGPAPNPLAFCKPRKLAEKQHVSVLDLIV